MPKSTPELEPGPDSDDDDDDRDARYDLPPGADASLDWGLTSHLLPDGSPRIVERVLLVPPELAGLRLDHFLKSQIPRLSRTKLQTVIATQLSGPRTMKPASIVASGDTYTIR